MLTQINRILYVISIELSYFINLNFENIVIFLGHLTLINKS